MAAAVRRGEKRGEKGMQEKDNDEKGCDRVSPFLCVTTRKRKSKRKDTKENREGSRRQSGAVFSLEVLAVRLIALRLSVSLSLFHFVFNFILIF